ncbi:uncharacterized protein LAESUDRAFT_722564 [Laetiporus sulphureus 93-53]|uniref:Uncharacterized protein n=1 Tax=Laetiporus sulphureus 93-53 TaxID=1314785 RepID=A0A165FZ33_9APHY|nr:uncharacterized protein LAESUDRAFT_722564 [Laetiporus sulphureus 93-53]KZT09602.1 hypothetical protein LAESUDRAFT_722564 [Laetiporus sulphureus 93-53]
MYHIRASQVLDSDRLSSRKRSQRAPTTARTQPIVGHFPSTAITSTSAKTFQATSIALPKYFTSL